MSLQNWILYCFLVKHHFKAENLFSKYHIPVFCFEKISRFEKFNKLYKQYEHYRTSNYKIICGKKLFWLMILNNYVVILLCYSCAVVILLSGIPEQYFRFTFQNPFFVDFQNDLRNHTDPAEVRRLFRGEWWPAWPA